VSYLKTLVALGMNRISLGVQTLNDDCLRTLGRRHTQKQALEAVHHVRQAGFNNLNLDFIWGLPGQTAQAWMEQLKLLVRLKPEHLSCYGLSIEPGTVFERIQAQNQLSLPPESEQAKMFVHGAEYLEAQGFLHYEISNFSRLGFACRHNQGYWDGIDYLGLGPAAVSTIKGRRWGNPKTLPLYALALDQGSLGDEAEELTPEIQIREKIMLALRTTRGLNVKKYQKWTGRDFIQTHAALIHTLRQNSLARLSRGYFRFTKNGLLVSNSILERVLEREEDLS
jgi:oxygen-independent coproporphyrinogen-3 oxidase